MQPKCETNFGVFFNIVKQCWTFHLCSPVCYRSSNFSKAKVVALIFLALVLLVPGFFSVLLPVYKSLYLSLLKASTFAIVGRTITIERATRQRTDCKNQARLIYTSTRRNSPIFLSQYWKNDIFDSSKIISYLDPSKIFSTTV